jgi:hypothetical protein
MAQLSAFRDTSEPALLSDYQPGEFYCELMGDVVEDRPRLLAFWQRLEQLTLADLSVSSPLVMGHFDVEFRERADAY